MTENDLIKILLCSYGYDRNVKVDTYDSGYEIYAEHESGDTFYYKGCEGFMFAIYEVLDYMKEMNVGYKNKWWFESAKDAINDEKREELVKEWSKNGSK